jgi:hypothetical protein
MPSRPACPPSLAELARAASGKFIRATTPLLLSTASKLMLALPWAGPLWGAGLTPTDNCRRQQNHKTQNPNRHFPSHIRTSSCHPF